MNRKILFAITFSMICTIATAFPHVARPMHRPIRVHRPAVHRAPVVHHKPVVHHHTHHHSVWGPGGSYFWPGFVGGVVGSTMLNTLAKPAPVIVQQTPVIQQEVVQTIWVEGRYVDKVQPNGTIQRVWEPGHYEQVTLKL